MGGLHMASQDLARVTREWRAVQVVNVAEDACFGFFRVSPWDDFERVGIRDRKDVSFLDTGEAVDRRSVEGHPVGQRVVEFGR